MGLSRFVCRDEQEREWQLDMHRRLQPQARRAVVVLAVFLVACLPWLNVLAAVPMVLAFTAYMVGSLLATRWRRKEPVLIGLLVTQLLIAAAVAVAGTEHTGGLMLLLFPIVGMCGGFPNRVVALCTAFTAAVMILFSLAIHGQIAIHNPPLLLVPLAVLISVAIVSTAVRDSSLEHQTAAVIDQLTGMLNRTALTTRTNELAHQSSLTGEPVGVLVADLDQFKTINDRDGHQHGDNVLRAFAYRLRKHLRAFDLAYRLGGDEFVILMPGADNAEALELAQRLIEITREEPLARTHTTISVGVAASERGSTFHFENIFSTADAALYEAKRQGRNRACTVKPLAHSQKDVAA
jgi:diguanylate cyclase (GGDEF)-like protein